MTVWIGLISVAVLAAAHPAGKEVPRPPDFLIVVLDDVGLYDIDRVPTSNLDWLASQGVFFRRAYSNPVRSPTRHSLLFGEFFGGIAGISCAGSSVAKAPSPALFSLPKMLKARGHATALFGKWHLGTNALGPWELSPHLHGFDVWRAGIPSNVPHCGGSSYWDWQRVDDGVSSVSSQYQTEALRDEFISWWTSTPSPRFAYLGFQNAHAPHHVPPPALLPSGFVVGSTRRDQYEAMLVSADFVLGEIFASIDLRSTWVIVIGDNGTPPEAVGPGQNRSKVKGTTFEQGIRVPLIIAGPVPHPGRTTDALAHASDVLASIADLAGARVPSGAARDSRSLLPILRGTQQEVRDSVISDHIPDTISMVGQASGQDRSVITKRWKLRRIDKVYTEEFYDLAADPDEESPIDPDDPMLDPELRKVIAALQRKLNAYEQR